MNVLTMIQAPKVASAANAAWSQPRRGRCSVFNAWLITVLVAAAAMAPTTSAHTLGMTNAVPIMATAAASCAPTSISTQLRTLS